MIEEKKKNTFLGCIINLITSNSKAMVIIISHNKNLIKKFKFVLKMENNKIELFKSKNYEV